MYKGRFRNKIEKITLIWPLIVDIIYYFFIFKHVLKTDKFCRDKSSTSHVNKETTIDNYNF